MIGGVGGQVKFYLYKEGGGRGTSFKFAEGAGGGGGGGKKFCGSFNTGV